MIICNPHNTITIHVFIVSIRIINCHAESTVDESQLTGLSKAIELPADSFSVDRHHRDGVLSVRGQLRKQDVVLLPANLGLVIEE